MLECGHLAGEKVDHPFNSRYVLRVPTKLSEMHLVGTSLIPDGSIWGQEAWALKNEWAFDRTDKDGKDFPAEGTHMGERHSVLGEYPGTCCVTRNGPFGRKSSGELGAELGA